MTALLTIENHIGLLPLKDLLRIVNYSPYQSSYKEEYISFTVIEGNIHISYFVYTPPYSNRLGRYTDSNKNTLSLPFTDDYLLEVVKDRLLTIYNIASSIVADSTSKAERIKRLKASLNISLYMFRVLQTYIREYNEII